MKAAKEVKIIAKYTNKKTGVVSYLVRSNDGKSTYCTTIIDGVASGCSCPSRNGKCYHRTQLQTREQESRKSAQEAVKCEGIVASRFAAQSVPVWVSAMVAKKVLSVPALPIRQAKVTDISTRGSLTKNRGFSIERIA